MPNRYQLNFLIPGGQRKQLWNPGTGTVAPVVDNLGWKGKTTSYEFIFEELNKPRLFGAFLSPQAPVIDPAPARADPVDPFPFPTCGAACAPIVFATFA